MRVECRVVMAGKGGGDEGWGAGVEAASAVVSGISQRLTCEGSHLLSFLPLGVGNPIKSPHSWQGERRHARSGSAWFENSRQKPE